MARTSENFNRLRELAFCIQFSKMVFQKGVDMGRLCGGFREHQKTPKIIKKAEDAVAVHPLLPP